MSHPTFLSLFAGIGGLDLGLERAGWSCVGQVEIDPYCQRVLARHWPEVPRWGDIKELHPDELPRADLIAGGFPCQPFSSAGHRGGIADERWLWPKFARIVRALRPTYVLMENVPGLLAEHGGMGIILGDLAESGYDAEWDCIPAAAVGAPHLRDRVWLVAYPNGSSRTADERQHPAVERPEQPAGDGQGRLVAHPDGQGQLQPPRRFGQEWGRPCHCRWWDVEPAVARVGHGISRRVDRERTLGNAVVPQVAEHIGRLILQQIPGAAARPVSVRPTTSPNAEGVPGESAAAPVHQSKTEVAERPRRVRPALFLSERPTSVLDVTHTTRGTP